MKKLLVSSKRKINTGFVSVDEDTGLILSSPDWPQFEGKPFIRLEEFVTQVENNGEHARVQKL